jgi:hypothetical protein
MRTDDPMSEADFQRILNSFPEEDQEESRSGPMIGASLCFISAAIMFAIIFVVMWWRA